MDRFCRQYLQLEDALDYPPPESLREESCQEQLYQRLFADGAYLPPHHYQLRVLKQLIRRIEQSIDDWDEHGVSDNLASALARLISQPQRSETVAAQQKSYVTYHLPDMASSQPTTGGEVAPTPSITLLESRSLIAASGTTGLRTWEAALHLGRYLCAKPETVKGKSVLELGAGTGYLTILCAKHLGAAHVIPSDGSDDVVNNLPDNIFLNGLQGDLGTSITPPMDLKWGHALMGTEESAWNGGRPVDLVLGADVTYDKDMIPSLVATLGELASMFPGVEMLVSAIERNSKTYEAFLEASGLTGLKVDHVNFPLDGTQGPFFNDGAPIHIVRLS